MNYLNPSQWPKWLIHIVVWGVLLAFPFLVSQRGSSNITWDQYLRFFIMLSSFVIVFYANYSCFVKRYLFRRETKCFLLMNILLISVLILSVHTMMELLPLPPQMPRMRPGLHHWDFLRMILMNIVGYCFIIAIAVAVKMTGSWYAAEAERKESDRSRSEAELQNLKSQLNPHFLFNTLNNIYSLIAISPERAQEVVHDLSRLLRYVLYDSSQPLVPVEKDLDFIRNYIELMRIRLPEHVSVSTGIQITSPDMLVAPLLLIAPIENAFKHGVSNSHSSFVGVKIEATDKQITCLIRNSYFPKNEQDKSGSGIGLANLRKRLDLIYPGKYTFTYGREADIYSCTLTLVIA